jgi:ABC-2 type transport system permease protein
MSRPSNVAVLWLFARVALRRAANGSALFAQRAAQNLSKATSRKATVPSRLQKSLGSRAFAASFGLMIVFGTALLLSRSIPSITQAVHLDEMSRSNVIPMAAGDYEALRTASKLRDAKQSPDEVDKALASMTDGYGSDWLESRGKEILHEKFAKQGIGGFRAAESTSEWRGNLALLSADGRLRALRGAGLYLLLIGGSGIFLTMGLMSRNLSRTDPALSWLFQFPVSRPVLFLSKLAESTFSNSVGPLAALQIAILSWGFGATFGGGLALTLMFGLAAAISAGAICLAIEIFLAQCCRRKTRGVIVSTAAALGSCGLMFAAYFPNAAPTTRVFLWMSDSLPSYVFWNPLSLGIGTSSMTAGIGPIWWIAPAITALGLATFAVTWATRLTARGLASAIDSVPVGARRAPIEPASEGFFSGLVWKELLQLRRQPEVLGQVLSAPLIVGFLLYIRNPDQFVRVAVGDVAGLCVSAFGAASYLLVLAGASVLRTELRTLWFLQCQPRSLADCLRIKARVWAGLAIAVGVCLLAAVVATQPGHRADVAIRAPFVIAYLWLMAEISFGLLSLGSTVVNETTVRMRRLQWVTPLLISAQCGATLYRGLLWEQSTLLVVLFVLSMAVRQKQLADLPWLSEPVENPPVRFDALDALLALLAFVSVRDLCGGILQHAVASVPMTLGGAYLIGAIGVWAVVSIWMRSTGRRIPVPDVARFKFRPIAIGLAATCLVGALWVGVLRHSSEAAMAQSNMRVPTTIGEGTAGNWLFLATIVLAAPIFEEWLFRGLLYRSLRRSWGIATSVVISALLFTAIHPMASSVAVLCLAVATALVLEKTGRLWPSMLVHVGYNAFIVALWNLPL